MGGHVDNLLVVRGFGTPLSLLLELIIHAHGGGQMGLISDMNKVAIEVVIIVAPDECLEVEAGENLKGFEEEPDRIVKVGTTGEQLCAILVELTIDLVDITVDRGPKHLMLLKLSRKVSVVRPC